MDAGSTGFSPSLDPSAAEFHPSPTFPFATPQFYLPPPHYVPPSHISGNGAASRAVVLSMLPPGLPEPAVLAAMEPFGAVRALDAAAVPTDGIATVHFFDLRAAESAVAEVREQHLRHQSLLRHHHQLGLVVVVPPPSPASARGLVAGRAVWADFAAGEFPDGDNYGCLVVLNADASVPLHVFRSVFEAFGDVKEVRGTAPSARPHRRFVEFFDLRDAARALADLKGKEVFGRPMVLDFSRPGLRSSRNVGFETVPMPPRLLNRRAAPSQSKTDSGGGSSSSGSINRKSSNTSHNGSSSSGGGGGRRSKSGGGGGGGSTSTNPPAAVAGAGGGRKGWRRGSGKGGETRFLFKEPTDVKEASSSASASSSSTTVNDSRTTVMIKNIPNKYSQKLLLNMLDNHCIHCNEKTREEGGDEDEPTSAYDFVYLPIDFNNKCNVGYGFVNLTSPEAAWRLYRAFHMQPWEVFNSRKICQVTYARLQGLDALKEHFRNSKFLCDNDEYMPVVFSPPRDGRQLTAPAPIGCRSIVPLAATVNLSVSSTPPAEAEAEEEEEEAISALTEAMLALSSSSHEQKD